MSLDEVQSHRKEIERSASNKGKGAAMSWQNNILADDSDDEACLICTL